MSNLKGFLAKWCDEQVANGKEVKITWEGGGDSGWLTMFVDDEEVDHNSEAAAIIGEMEEVLDYGSWAGEFSASGEAIYDAETKSFTGTDYYSEDEWENVNDDLVIRVPTSIKFDGVFLEADDSFCEVKLIVQNGFKSLEHEKIENKLTEYYAQYAEEVLSNHGSYETQAYSSETIPFADFTLSDDGKEYICDTCEGPSFRIENSDEREIVLNLEDNE